MNWTAEAHNEWHHAHGKYVTCPLDCGASEVYDFDCVICGASCAEYSDGVTAHRGCADAATCDKALADFRQVLEEEKAAQAALPDPWAKVF